MLATRISDHRANDAGNGSTAATRPAARGRPRRSWPRFAISWASVSRYGLAILFLLAGALVASGLERWTGKFSAFPFYAAVVAPASLGVGPGVLALRLSPPAFAARVAPAPLRL